VNLRDKPAGRVGITDVACETRRIAPFGIDGFRNLASLRLVRAGNYGDAEALRRKLPCGGFANAL
jgi:hypothetical protein